MSIYMDPVKGCNFFKHNIQFNYLKAKKKTHGQLYSKHKDSRKASCLKGPMNRREGQDLCNVFEMLVERLSNIEEKIERVEHQVLKLQKMEAYIESKKQDDNHSEKGSVVSGMLHGGLPVRIHKCYESEEMFLEGGGAYKEKQRNLMIIDNSGEIFMRLEERDIRSNSDLFQEIASCITEEKELKKGKALINAIHGTKSTGEIMNTYTYVSLGLNREDYKHASVETELVNMYIQSKLPYVKNVSWSEIMIDLRDLYIHNQIKKGARPEEILEEEVRKEVTIEEVMEVMKEVMKLMKIEKCNHGSEIKLYTFPAYAEDLLVAIQEQEWHKVKRELQLIGHHSLVYKMMKEQMERTRLGKNKPEDYFDSYRICNSWWRDQELFGI